MSLGTNNKVNTSTQVEHSLVGARSIVGQEDTAVDYLSKSDMRKDSKGIRPPLVGQASSSSNDSVSLSFETSGTGITQNRPLTPPAHTLFDNPDQNKTNYSADDKKPSNLVTRNDFNYKKPAEGSFILTSSSVPMTEVNYDLTRVRSSSSASSVTSSRPLEWDNGADVGYSQSYLISGKQTDPNMSTVERMALVSSTKLLRRSDPEGTTGGTSQQIKSFIQPKPRIKNKYGYPNAESTPLGTCVPSDASPDTFDFISPIPYEKRDGSEQEINSSESETTEGVQKLLTPIQEGYTVNQTTHSQAKDDIKLKIPLFPEVFLNNKKQNGVEFDRCRVLDENVPIDIYCDGNTQTEGKYITAHSKTKQCTGNQEFNIDLKSKLESVESLSRIHKKLSSSLENVSNLSNNDHSDEKNIPNTLPRSHSQSDLYMEKLSCGNNTYSKCSNIAKGNITIQNLIKNKSASSSSVATVVHRKGDSPKHAIVQTSLFNKQSVGTQAFDSMERNRMKSKVYTDFAVSETPHLPKAVLPQQLIKRSNYFEFIGDSVKDNTAAVQKPVVNIFRDHSEENKIKSNDFRNGIQSHFHNGILCRGAHKKKVVSENLSEQSINFRNSNSGDQDTNVVIPNISQLKSVVCSSSLNTRKTGTGGFVDSVESSAKSGGFGTDKQYSVTVEDRVNSFEYLPGHVYESNERQQPVNSCGTSSMSIENQTSKNGTPDGQNKMWESSGGSMSSTFEKDAQRGVDIISDFIKVTYENDSLLKRKLIRRVVDKLISKNHIDRKIESFQDLMKNTPWVPPRPSNPIERNNIKTPKSKVPCEFSSHSEKSGTTNTSSECFIPRPADKNKYLPSFLRDGPCEKDQGEFSSTSNVTLEKSTKHLDRSSKPLQLLDNKLHKLRRNYIPKQSRDSSSDKVVRSSNWKEPVTKTEKLIEERRKIQNESSGSHCSISQLLDMERENQLFWIRSEIEHLSNLKQLLERQEELKRGLKNYKPRHTRSSERGVLKDKNRVEKERTHNTASTRADVLNKKSSMKAKSSYSPKLSEWLRESVAVPKSHDNELEGWASHQYENDENIKSCLKRKSKHQTQQKKTITSLEDRGDVMYDEPPITSGRSKHALKHQKQTTAANDNQSESAYSYDKDHTSSNLAERIGSRPRVSVPKSGCQCLCQGKCLCCGNLGSTEDRKKEPLGYYIMFDNPKKDSESKMEKHRLEETGISLTMGKRKQKSVGLERAGYDHISEKERANLGKKGNSGSSDCLGSETEPVSGESENDRNKKPIFKVGAGELQYYLLHNRPSYVSRAEDRRQCIAQMQYLRELSSQNKRRLLSLTKPDPPPPPPIKMQRVFSQHKMRQMTEKKYRQLSEVKEKLQDTKKKESYRTNRLMAEIFKKNLQKRVLKGDVNLSNSVLVISSL